MPSLGDLPLVHGVYAVETALGRGLANWGVAPTMGARAWPEPVLEVHLLNAPTTPPPTSLRVAFTAFIRPERTFSSIAELQEQLARDKQSVATGSTGGSQLAATAT